MVINYLDMCNACIAACNECYNYCENLKQDTPLPSQKPAKAVTQLFKDCIKA